VRNFTLVLATTAITHMQKVVYICVCVHVCAERGGGGAAN
jgi:hypothetical protein